MTDRPAFEVDADQAIEPGQTLLVAVSNVGMAGLTAVDHLVSEGEAEQIGRVRARQYPSIAPFADGRPRDHSRLYDFPDRSVTALTTELFVPITAAEAFADAVADWIHEVGIEEVVLFNGVPYPHGPEEHAVFSVATDEYREQRLDALDSAADGAIKPLRGGFLDGIPGEFLTRAVEGTVPPSGVLVTPTHPPGPDIDAALLFLNAVQRIYGFETDVEELERASEEIKRYYAELAQRVQNLGDGSGVGRSDYPEDRAYM